MLLAEEKGILIENPDYSDIANFRALVLAEFPSLAEDFAKYEDLLHVQMGTFSHLAQSAIEQGDFGTVQDCYQLLEEVLKTANANFQNAIYVSFLENLNFETLNGKKARQLLPDTLSKMLEELEEHLQMLYNYQTKRQEEE